MQSIAWSPDSKRIATSDDEGKVKIWNVKTGELISSYTGSACSELPLNCSVSVVVWSPDGRYIASGSCGVIDPLTPDNVAVQIRNAITGDLVLTYHGHSSCVQNITWPSNSRNIISSSSDNTMRI